MDTDLGRAIDEARDHTALFRIVKRVVEKHTGRSRAGMMLGLSSLGLAPDGFLGGYFVVGTNAIVLNRDVLHYIQANEPSYHNAYAFHVLLHEYLHTLGWLREDEVRPLAHAISRAHIGPDHATTLIAAAMDPTSVPPTGAPELFRRLAYPAVGWRPPQAPVIEIIKGFDPDATSYIA